MNIYKAISANIWKSYFIIALFILFAGTIAYIFGSVTGYGPSIGVGIFIFAIIYSFISYFYSDKIVLMSSGAQEIKEKDNPKLFHIVENLAIGDGIPMPRVYIIDDPSPNAFATGRDPQHAAVAATTGILERLNKSELEGVLAHELSHVKNYDTRLMAITAVLVGFIALITDLFLRNLFWGGFRNDDDRDNRAQIIFLVIAIVLAIIAPIIASLIQLAVSRKRELLADASGALLTRYPEGLASALEKISSDPRPLRTASNATAHLFIVNPFKEKGFSSWVSNLFSTHPPTEQRIKILRSM
ncbi:MAG TPA: zinc metalloprotease HtpX [Candidatus Sulfotelmatobacter sp.]|jgi:heat shock protein HtpX|nr:zinc metalloprotease HtpX [Candidatus Sulfotelmatobacter sp.]